MNFSADKLIYSPETLGYYNTDHIVCMEPYVKAELKEEYQKEGEETSRVVPLAQIDKEREIPAQYFLAVLLSIGKPVFFQASSELNMQELLENWVSKFSK